jgi:hypothetical protein
MTSVASLPSYQSIQWLPAGWAFLQPSRLYQTPWIRTSREVRQAEASQASTAVQVASELQSKAWGDEVEVDEVEVDEVEEDDVEDDDGDDVEGSTVATDRFVDMYFRGDADDFVADFVTDFSTSSWR